jgi:hypothetical protein
MKNWMKSVVPLFVLAIAPLARAEGAGDQTMRDQVKEHLVAGAQGTGASAPEAQQVGELRETVDRLARRVMELETRQDTRNINLGNPDDHGGWW